MNAISDLRGQIHRELALRDQGHAQVHAADQEALHTAQQSMGHRLEAMNEFRAAMAHQSSTFVTRTEESATHAGVQERIDQLSLAMRALEMSHSTLQARLYTIVSVVTVAVTIISVLMKFAR